MRVRNTLAAVAVVAVAALSNAPVALAQGEAPVTRVTPATQVTQVTRVTPLTRNSHNAYVASVPVGPVAATVPDERRLFTAPAAAPAPTPPTVLGEGWAGKLRAALDGVQHVLDRLEAQQAIRVKEASVHVPLPVVPAWRAAWAPASALREAVSRSPVQMTPVYVSPATESLGDTRGEHAVLLGVRAALPWMVP